MQQQKKQRELIAHSYSNLYNLKSTGLRFFTVYGPWGRPDMAYYSFTKAIIDNQEIPVFNNGNLKRDFTYIDDAIESIVKVLDRSDNKNFQIYNVGNNRPIKLLNFLNTLEKILNKKARITYMEHQKGDVYETWANIDPIVNDFGYKPKTDINEGLQRFIDYIKDIINGLKKKQFIFMAGEAGESTLFLFEIFKKDVHIHGFIDDDSTKIGSVIHGLNVFSFKQFKQINHFKIKTEVILSSEFISK